MELHHTACVREVRHKHAVLWRGYQTREDVGRTSQAPAICLTCKTGATFLKGKEQVPTAVEFLLPADPASPLLLDSVLGEPLP